MTASADVGAYNRFGGDGVNTTFNVIRLTSGPKKGQVWIVPNCRQGGYRMRNGRECSRPLLRAQSLISCVSYASAYWFAVGLLEGETGKILSPYMKPGRAKHWKLY